MQRLTQMENYWSVPPALRDLKVLVEKGLFQGAGTSPTDPNRVYSRGPVLVAGSYDKL